MINIENFDSPCFDEFDINLVQKEVDGGNIAKEQIDLIKEYPNAKSIIISGLKQDTFEYFVCTYGKQFEAISFWKNKAVSDLSSLASLVEVRYISYFFNQKTCELWDMSNNERLEGLSISDFSKLKSINEIEKAKNLSSFFVYDRVDAKMQLETLSPVVNSCVNHFCWGGKKVIDGDFECLANGKIEVLDISPTQFTMLELAELLSLFPESLKGIISKPYVTGEIKDIDGCHEYFYLCKKKKTCEKGIDDKRFARYLNEFEELLKNCREKNKGN